MTAHLPEISAVLEPGAHAVVILDQTGRHMSKALVVPGNLTLVPPSPRSPELNGREHLAVHRRQLALEPRLRELRGHRRLLLRDVERPHRPPL